MCRALAVPAIRFPKRNEWTDCRLDTEAEVLFATVTCRIAFDTQALSLVRMSECHLKCKYRVAISRCDDVVMHPTNQIPAGGTLPHCITGTLCVHDLIDSQ